MHYGCFSGLLSVHQLSCLLELLAHPPFPSPSYILLRYLLYLWAYKWTHADYIYLAASSNLENINYT